MTGMLRSVAVAAALFLGLLTTAQPADERAFWNVWTRHAAATNRHAEIIAACEAFEKANPDDPLIVVTRQLASWRLLKLRRIDDAAALLAPMANSTATSLDTAASRIARAWLTRIDRDTVKAALQQIYLRDVGYPETLDALTKRTADAPTPVDRWGRPWNYRLVGFQHIRGLPNQKYELRSAILGADSDLAGALAAPYGGRIRLHPIRLKTIVSGKPLVEFDTGANAGSAVLSVGAKHDRVTFAYMGDRIILLSDGSHWKAVPTPRR